MKACGRLVAGLAACAFAAAAGAEVQVDPLGSRDLPASANPHWVWVNDVVFHHMADGKAFLLDGDRGTMLGMLNTGFSFNGVVLPADRAVIYSPEIYFSRGTRGTRTDVVTVYDARKLAPVGEIPLGAQRASSIPMLANSGLTDDGRFLLIYNFTPAQSVSVVDTVARKFLGEVEIPGCALIYPTGPRGFFSLCNDGAALQVKLGDDGKALSKTRSARLFDAERDPVTEKAVRSGSIWYFVSFGGAVVPVDVSGAVPRNRPGWSLLDDAARKEGWLPGGTQHLALHRGSQRLYSLMHVGGPSTHKDPGKEIWVYELGGGKRVQRIALGEIATSIAVTQDDKPLLFAMFAGAPKVEVYDARSGSHLRTIGEIGFTPMTFVTY